jgi:hypothetical protein
VAEVEAAVEMMGGAGWRLPWGLWRSATIISTARAAAIKLSPGLVTVHLSTQSMVRGREEKGRDVND